MSHLLEVQGLRTYFYTNQGTAPVLDGLSFNIRDGEILGLAGESGAGKSVTAYSIMRLVRPPGKIISGNIIFRGKNLLGLSEREMEGVRGGDISMIFQHPRESLNPVIKVGNQLELVLQIHRGINSHKAYDEAIKLLIQVNLSDPDKIMESYPHQLSGGMCQRVMIALSLSSNPKFLIADEATTNLDVTTQLQIIRLLKKLRDDFGLTILIITHDLGVIAELCDRVLIMYAGEIVERASVQSIFVKPKHPYTKALLDARPVLGLNNLPKQIPGEIVDLYDLPSGCKFHPRCPFVFDRCKVEEPKLIEVNSGHDGRCFLHYS